MRAFDGIRTIVCTMLIATLATAAGAQSPPAGPAASAAAKNLKPEEIEALVAPIALYPDAVLSQVLMASTYPVEVVMAQRWTAEHKSLKGDTLTQQLEQQDWDPSVKSLVNFPDTLNMMSEKLDWTIKLGDAFIGQQKDVLDAVQRLRGKARASGNLESNTQQKVTSVTAPPGSTTTNYITIESPTPDTVYVPVYNPTVVYGGWPYPAYPPYYYYPPAYPVGAPAVWFGTGVAVGAAWGYAWGVCDWGHGNVNVNVNRNTNINNNINRAKYQNFQANQNTVFQHDPAHRRGVTYRDNATAQRFGGWSDSNAILSRNAFRGRAEAGRAELAGGNVNRPLMGESEGPARLQQPRQELRNRFQGGQLEPGAWRGNASAFSGLQSSSLATRNASDRGSFSRGSAPVWGGAEGGFRDLGGRR